MEKTNALRILDKAGIPYVLHNYQSDGVALDAIEVAYRLNQSIDKVYKTLVTIGASQRIYVLVINGADELNLKKTAAHLHEKHLELLPLASLLKVTGYVRGGCSPIGMKKLYATYFDEKILSLDRVIVSAGRIGLQMEIEPALLIQCVDGQTIDLVQAM